MPQKLHWTTAQDFTIRRMRAEAGSWDRIARALGMSRYTVLERGRRIGAALPLTAIVPPPEDPRREAMPAGDPRSWGPITAGTLLEGCPYPLPCFES